jgi:predicted nucleic acid-binding protein
VTQALGWLDTNLFIHSLSQRDTHYRRCTEIVKDLARGDAEGWIDVVVVHELTYTLPRFDRQRFDSAGACHQYIRSILSYPGVRADDKDELLEILAEWDFAHIGFADARLRVLARRRNLPVCSVNRRDFSGTPNTF